MCIPATDVSTSRPSVMCVIVRFMCYLCVLCVIVCHCALLCGIVRIVHHCHSSLGLQYGHCIIIYYMKSQYCSHNITRSNNKKVRVLCGDGGGGYVGYNIIKAEN